jgi:hypothetical protein
MSASAIWTNRHSIRPHCTRCKSATDKRGRPEVLVEMDSLDRYALHVCLKNYSSLPALNLRVDDIPCGDGVLKFENVPTKVTSAFGPTLQAYFQDSDGTPRNYDVVHALLFAKKEKVAVSDEYHLAVRYTDADAKKEWVTFCRFAYDFKEWKLMQRKQWIEPGETQVIRAALQRYLNGETLEQSVVHKLHDAGLMKTQDVTNMDTPLGQTELLPTGVTEKGTRVLNGSE